MDENILNKIYNTFFGTINKIMESSTKISGITRFYQIKLITYNK